MKKNLLIIFTTLTLFSCIQDDIRTPIQPRAINNELTSTEFVKGSEDIPLVSNLELIDSGNINFDSQTGSFITVDYQSPIDLEVVQGFYIKTLPQMGWDLVKNDHVHSIFLRDNERLEIELFFSQEEEEKDLIRFSLSSGMKK